LVNGRLKGNSAEREICKILSKYFSGKFERRSMGMKGSDIICPVDFPYEVEVKHDKALRLKHFWQPTKKLEEFWQQTVNQACYTDKMPLLCAKVEGIWFCWQTKPFHTAQLLEDWCLINSNQT